MTSASASASFGSSPSPSALRLAPVPSRIPFGSSTISPVADVVDPAGADLASKLHALEDLLDQSYAAAGDLAGAIVRARIAHGLSTTVGHSIVASFDQAASAVVSARGHAVKGHRLLAQLGERIGAPVNYGDGAKDAGDAFTGA